MPDNGSSMSRARDALARALEEALDLRDAARLGYTHPRPTLDAVNRVVGSIQSAMRALDRVAS